MPPIRIFGFSLFPALFKLSQDKGRAGSFAPEPVRHPVEEVRISVGESVIRCVALQGFS
jgi:hypothetical protein